MTSHLKIQDYIKVIFWVTFPLELLKHIWTMLGDLNDQKYIENILNANFYSYAKL